MTGKEAVVHTFFGGFSIEVKKKAQKEENDLERPEAVRSRRKTIQRAGSS